VGSLLFLCALFSEGISTGLALLPSSPCHACFTSPLYAVAKAKGGANGVHSEIFEYLCKHREFNFIFRGLEFHL
jgi:hypothetical protein